jgi:hypothetical protein
MAVDLDQISTRHFAHASGETSGTNWAARTAESQKRIAHSLAKPHYLTPDEAGRCIATDRGWELIPVGQSVVGRKSTELLQAIAGLSTMLDVDNISDATRQARFQAMFSDINVTGGMDVQTQRLHITGATISRRSKTRYALNVAFSEAIIFSGAPTTSATFTATLTAQPSGTNDEGVSWVSTSTPTSPSVDYSVVIPASGSIELSRLPFILEFPSDIDSIAAFDVTGMSVVPGSLTAVDRQGTTVDLGATIDVVNAPYTVSYGTQY